MSREKKVLIGAAIAAAVVAGTVIFLNSVGPSAQQQAAEWAQQACSHYTPDQAPTINNQPGPASTQNPTQEAANWQTVADDAAHAARLDPTWQNLAMAANVQLEEWQAAANGQQPTAAQAAAAEQYNINVECRKAKD